MKSSTDAEKNEQGGWDDPCARATRAGSSVWLAGLSGLSGSPERISSPINQTNQIDEIDQMNQHSLDARSWYHPSHPL
jgi:hypothetical protein